MSTVICKINCPYQKSEFCTKNFVVICGNGVCKQLVKPDTEIYSDPSYHGVEEEIEETEPEVASEQASPHENLDGEAETETESVPSEKSEDDKSRED